MSDKPQKPTNSVSRRAFVKTAGAAAAVAATGTLPMDD